MTTIIWSTDHASCEFCVFDLLGLKELDHVLTPRTKATEVSADRRKAG